MRALVVVESMFGNTREVARAVARGLFPMIEVDLREVGHAPTRPGADVGLLVVGGPTHAFGMTRPSTRSDARADGALVVAAPDVGLREWLAVLEPATPGTLVATFDTRVHRPRLPGSAARGARKALRQRGFLPLDAPESFWVEGTTGPLLPGETERARAWGAALGRSARAREHVGRTRA